MILAAVRLLRSQALIVKKGYFTMRPNTLRNLIRRASCIDDFQLEAEPVSRPQLPQQRSMVKIVDLDRFATINQNTRNPWSTSSKYSLVSTRRVTNILEDHGWYPVRVEESRVRSKAARGFLCHVIRLRHEGDLARPIHLEGECPEIILLNNHSGSASFRVMTGFYRHACANGLVHGDSCAEYRIRHVGYTDKAVTSAVADIMAYRPELIEKVANFKRWQLSEVEQFEFAQTAVAFRFDAAKVFVSPKDLLRIRRRQDRPSDLWTIFNRVQEHLLEGEVSQENRETGELRRAARIRSIDKRIKVNRALWNLMQRTANRLSSSHRGFLF